MIKKISVQTVEVIETIFVLKKNECTIMEHTIPIIAKRKSSNMRGVFEGEVLHNVTCISRKKNIPKSDDVMVSYIYSVLSSFKISRNRVPKKFIDFPKIVSGPTLGWE